MSARFSARLLRARSLFVQLGRKADSNARRLRRAFLLRREEYYRSFWRSAAEAMGAKVDDLGHGFLRISDGRRTTYVRNYQVMLDNHLSLAIAGNKHLSYRFLAEAGQRAPPHAAYGLGSLHKAVDFLDACGGPVVVKPLRNTGAGNGVTTNIRDRRRLVRASVWAAGFGEELLVERQIPGHSYRLLYLGGRLIDAVRRDPPRVVGDGKRSLKELVHAENERRLTGPVVALSPIVPDLDCEYHLAYAGRTLRAVPDAGESVVVKSVVNQNSASENRRESYVHPSIAEVCGRFVATLDLDLAGVDVLAPTLAAPLEESGGVINEVNTTPGLHHHDLVAEEDPRLAIGPLVLRFVFAQHERRREACRAGAEDWSAA